MNAHKKKKSQEIWFLIINLAPSTNWLGGNPLKVKMAVRIRLGSPMPFTPPKG